VVPHENVWLSAAPNTNAWLMLWVVPPEVLRLGVACVVPVASRSKLGR